MMSGCELQGLKQRQRNRGKTGRDGERERDVERDVERSSIREFKRDEVRGERHAKKKRPKKAAKKENCDECGSAINDGATACAVCGEPV